LETFISPGARFSGMLSGRPTGLAELDALGNSTFDFALDIGTASPANPDGSLRRLEPW